MEGTGGISTGGVARLPKHESPAMPDGAWF